MQLIYLKLPKSEPDSKRDLERLTEDFRFYINNIDYKIPAGFEWNGASVPWLFWAIVGTPFEPDLRVGSLIHDWFYLTHMVNRKKADECLFIAADKCYWKKVAIWQAVRIAASFAWKSDEKDKKDASELVKIIVARPDAALWALEISYLMSV